MSSAKTRTHVDNVDWVETHMSRKQVNFGIQLGTRNGQYVVAFIAPFNGKPYRSPIADQFKTEQEARDFANRTWLESRF